MDRSSGSGIAATAHEPVRVAFHGFVLDQEDARLSEGGRAIALPPKAFAVLCTLVRNAGRLVTKDALLDAVWGHRHVTESVLKSTISQVRAALRDDVRQPRFIETASRHGYRFIATPSPPPGPTAAPGLPSSPDARPFVGREADMQRIDRAWARARQGQRRLVWVSGEAGVGKTALVERWLEMAVPAVVMRGHCMEPFGASEHYLPVLEAVATLCRGQPAFADSLRRSAPSWLLQLPWLVTAGEAAELRAQLAGSSQERMLRELCEWLEQASQEQPMLLLLEDLHWCDVSTVRLLEYIARRRAPAGLLVVGSFRSAELVALDHPLKYLRHELRVQGLCDEIALDPLSERDVVQLLRAAWPGAENERLAVAIHAHTDGLPVFLVNVIDDLRARTAGDAADTQACLQALAMRVPDSLGGVIGKQFSRLAPTQRAILQAASIRGRAFSQRCVECLLPSAAAGVLDELEQLALADFWIEAAGVERMHDGRLRANYRFRHALYQQAILAATGPVERAEAHLRLARDLEARVAEGERIPPAELALHYQRARANADALRWQVDAAGSALARVAPEEAAALAGQGLEMLAATPVSEERDAFELSLRVTLGVASAQRFGVGSDRALAELQRASRLCNSLPHGPQHVWLMNGLGWTHFSRGDFTQAAASGLAMAQRADEVSDQLLRLCAANLMGAVRVYSGHLDDAQAWLDLAAALAPDSVAAETTVRTIVDLRTSVHVYRAQALLRRGRLAEAESETGLAIGRARSLNQPMSLCLALRCACQLAISGIDARLGDLTAELHALAFGMGITQSLGPAHWYRGWWTAHAGDPAEGLRQILDGIEGHRRLGMSTGLAMAHGYASQAALWMGDPAQARDLALEGIALAQSLGETIDQPALHRLLAQVERNSGRHAEASAAEQRALACAAGIGAA